MQPQRNRIFRQFNNNQYCIISALQIFQENLRCAPDKRCQRTDILKNVQTDGRKDRMQTYSLGAGGLININYTYNTQ